jgi:hypothetical protein
MVLLPRITTQLKPIALLRVVMCIKHFLNMILCVAAFYLAAYLDGAEMMLLPKNLDST